MIIGIYFNYMERGPGKVVNNLLSGFNKNKISYKINSEGDINLILQNVDRIKGDLSNCILGPNICTLPIDNNFILNYDRYLKLVVPSEWVKDKYSKWIPNEKIETWPVGIDTDKFKPSHVKKEYDFLIYFKRRDRNDLSRVVSFLETKNKSYLIIEYGRYSELQFIDFISKSKYGIVIDSCESQGIAIQEMMSCNLPLLVWDKTYWDDRGEKYKFNATSIPYFDDSCGITFSKFEDLNNIFNIFINNKYKPRNYIINNLSIQKSTDKILKIINENFK